LSFDVVDGINDLIVSFSKGIMNGSNSSFIPSAHNDIPENLYKTFFSFLDFTDLCACSLVCKHWKKISEQNGLWKTIFKRYWPKEYKRTSEFPISSPTLRWKDLFANHFLQNNFFGDFGKENLMNEAIIHKKRVREDNGRKPLQLLQPNQTEMKNKETPLKYLKPEPSKKQKIQPFSSICHQHSNGDTLRQLEMDLSDKEIVECMKKQMLKKEEFYQPKSYYFRLQPHLNETMRSILFDWLMEVSEEYHLTKETTHLSFNYIDRVLCTYSRFPREKYQLLGITCLFIASKIEEIHALKPKDVVLVTDKSYTFEEVTTMEALIPQNLGWNLLPPTAISWLKMFFALSISDNIMEVSLKFPRLKYVEMAQIIDYCVLDFESVQFLPSVIAASVFSQYCVSSEEFLRITGYQHQDEPIVKCLSWITKFNTVPTAKICSAVVEMLPRDFHERQYRNPQALPFLKKNLHK